MDGEKEIPQILGDMIINQTQYRPIDGLSRSPYHAVFTDLALIEGATGLDLSSEGRLKHAVMQYWHAVKKTIQLFKLQYQAHKQDETVKVVAKLPVKAPPLAMDDGEASAEVTTSALQI
jgi:hypothetical protein